MAQDDDGTRECADCSGDGANEVCTIQGCGEIIDNCPHDHVDGVDTALQGCKTCDGYGYIETD